ncbi:MAG: hypothetical protein JST55_02125 [Bacteroidetes bacterium]|nr:hypothetical protein [Bacteroidota bacterium]
MKLFFSGIFIFTVFSLCNAQDIKLLPPSTGIYHGTMAGWGINGDSVNAERVKNFTRTAGKDVAVVYFGQNWFDGIKFPAAQAQQIYSTGAIPFISLLPRSSYRQYRMDSVFSMLEIVEGDFDKELTQWAIDARNSGIPMMLDFAPEMNGNWFPWSGQYNFYDGNVKTAGKLYKDTYRHIVDIFRKAGATNITWAFHPNGGSSIQEEWNNMKRYYPGDDYVDWIGVSIYGSQRIGDRWLEIIDNFDEIYDDMAHISAKKPLAIFEFGVTEDKDKGDKSQWIKDVFDFVTDKKYNRIKLISYWNQNFPIYDKQGRIINYSLMQIDTSPEVLYVYRENINKNIFISKPILSR